MKSQKSNAIICFSLLTIMIISTSYVKSISTTTQDFSLINETKIFLDMETSQYYNGSLSVTVSSGDNVTASLNDITKVVSVGNPVTYQIFNISKLYFTLTSTGESVGTFVLTISIERNYSGNQALFIILVILGSIFFLGAAVSYFIRSKKAETKPDEEEAQLVGAETLEKRKEAAGAEKKFWGLDDKK